MFTKALTVLVVVLVLISGVAHAEEAEEYEQQLKQELSEGIDEVISEVELSGLEEWFNSSRDAFGGASLEEAIRQVGENGLDQFSAEQVINAVFAELSGALVANGGNIVQILIILLLGGILMNMRGSFSSEGVAKAGFWTVYVLVSALAAGMLVGCVNTARTAMEQLTEMTETLTPILIALLSSVGGLVSESVLNPVMAALTGSVFVLIRTIVFPAILVSAVLALASNMSSTIKLGKMSKLIESGVKWFIGIVMMIFLGVMAIKGLTGATIDGLSFKTAKYTIDKLVPVIGGMFSDTLDTLMSCSLIVKSAVGAVGLITIAVVLAGPLATLLVNMFLFKIASAVAEPFADSSCVNMLSSMGNVVLLMFVCLLTCIAMSFISISLLMGTANLSAALR